MGYISDLFINVLSTSTIATVALGMILLARNLLKNKVSIQKSTMLWIIFIILLIFPINFSSKLSIKNYIDAEKNIFANLFRINSSKNSKLEYAEEYMSLGSDAENNFINDKNTPNYLDNLAHENIYLSVFSTIWLAMIIIKDLYIYCTFTRKKSISKVPNYLLKTLENCKQKLNITRNIEIIMQEDIKTPSICGIVNPKILLTSEILKLSDEEMNYVILHELNHYKKFHHVYYLFFKLVENVYWFNPFIKLAIKIIKKDLELITDEQVVNAGAPIKAYCKTILKVATIATGSTCLAPTICTEKDEIERRIIHMKSTKIYSKFSLLLLVVAIAVISIVSISLASDELEKTPESDTLGATNDIFYEIIEEAEKEQQIKFVLPVKDGKITAKYGKRVHPITGEERFHSGVDIAIEEGEDVYAIAPGEVIYAGFDTEHGNSVEVKHADGSVSKYNHGLEILVEEGTKVEAGEKIMLVGKTGMATGAHLHLEVKDKNGEYVDINYMFEE